MGKGRIKKVVGQINDEVVDRYELYDYRGRDVIQSMDLYIHIAKHRNEFQSIDSYNNTLSNIENIIAKPNFVYYEKQRNTLLYFKKIDENVCVVVRLELRANKDCFIASIYPVSESKITRLKEQSYINNRE